MWTNYYKRPADCYKCKLILWSKARIVLYIDYLVSPNSNSHVGLLFKSWHHVLDKTCVMGCSHFNPYNNFDMLLLSLIYWNIYLLSPILIYDFYMDVHISKTIQWVLCITYRTIIIDILVIISYFFIIYFYYSLVILLSIINFSTLIKIPTNENFNSCKNLNLSSTIK